MRMSIRTKMIINFVPLLIAFVVVMAIAYQNLTAMHENADKAALLLREGSTMGRLQASASRAFEGVHDYLLSADKENRQRFALGSKAVRRDLAAAAAMDILESDGEEVEREKALLTEAQQSIEEALDIGEKVMELNLPEQSQTGYDLMRHGDRELDQALAAIRLFREIDEEELAESLLRLHAVHATVQLILAGFFLIGIVSLVSIAGVTRSFTRPIYKFVKGVRFIGQGNLDYRLHINTGDEIQDLAEAFNEMVFNLYQEEQTAAEIQRRLLPPDLLSLPGVRLHARQLQAKLVGGDWYDYYRIGNKLYLLIADASGKGMPGALLATVAMSALRSEPKTQTSMEELLVRTNKTVENRLGGSDFVTIFLAEIDLETREMNFVNAGHEPPLVYSTEYASWSLLQCASGIPLGIGGMDFDPKLQRTSLAAGDKLILYTDGIHDVRDPSGRFFNLEIMIRWLNEHRELAIEPLMDSLVQEALRFGNNQLIDDITLLGMEIDADASGPA